MIAGKKIEGAIVVHSGDLNGLGQELREQVPRTIMLGHRTDEIRRWEHTFREADVPAQEVNEQKLLDQLREPIALPGGGGDGTRARPVVLTIEDCRLDLAAHVFVDGNGREVPLTRAEFALLAVFTGSPRQVLSRDQLRRAVVGRGAGSDDRSIDMLVARLRRKIEPNPKAPRFILCVAGVGYKFAVRPQPARNQNGSTLDAGGRTIPAPRSIGIADLHEHKTKKVSQVAAHDAPLPRYALTMSHQGKELVTDVPLTSREVERLAVEATCQDLTTSHLVGQILVAAITKDMIQEILRDEHPLSQSPR